MKVLHVIFSLGLGGAERLLTQLLPRMRPLGVDVAVICVAEDDRLRPSLEEAGVPVEVLGFRGTIYSLGELYRARGRLRDAISRVRPDVVHSHLFLADILAALATPRGVALVSTLHSSDPWWLAGGGARARCKAEACRVAGIVRGVRYIAVSSAAARDAVNLLGVRGSRVRVVHNGIDLSEAAPDGEEGRRRERIVQVGRFREEKGHAVSLVALRLLREKEAGVELTFVGDGPLRGEVEKEAERLGVRDVVRFAGTQDNVWPFLRNAAVFWMPSLWEGMPLACIEAMAAGLPVVASDVEGLRETVGAEAGVLIPVRDAGRLASVTVELMRDPVRMRAMGVAGRERAHRMFSIDGTVRRYVEAYENVLSGVW